MDEKIIDKISSKETSFVDNVDKDTLAKALDYFKKDCQNKIDKLSYNNFLNYDKISNLQRQITDLKVNIYDGEAFLNMKETDNPRELRDTIEDLEIKKVQITNDVRRAKEKLEKLEIELDDLQTLTDNQETEILKLSRQIQAADRLYEQKINK